LVIPKTPKPQKYETEVLRLNFILKLGDIFLTETGIGL